jgi:hypothetical protein
MKAPTRAAYLVALVVTISPATAQNLLQNGGFDTSLIGWSSVGSGTSTWQATDASGSLQSGSARLVTSAVPGETVESIDQCVAVGGDAEYTLNLRLLRVVGEVTTVFGGVQWYDDQACQSFLEGTTPIQVFANQAGAGAWETRSGTVERPAAAGSARIRITARKETDAAVTLNVDDVVFAVESGGCVQSDSTLCLNDNRFAVTIDWRSANDEGVGHAVPLTADTGYFWFFNDENVEVVIKVLDACSTAFDSFWVFAAGLTDVEVDLRVTDLEAEETRTYFSDLGQPFEAIQDTSAFDTCE